jgi:hypothetical protein
VYHIKSTKGSFVFRDSIWIVGTTRSGKTNRLIQQLQRWAAADITGQPRLFSSFLVFAATGDNRLELDDRIVTATQGQYRFISATPLGFFQDEVLLFLPLLARRLDLKVPFPLRLRPETEQELATNLWRSLLDQGRLRLEGVSDYFVVRRTLDLLQLAAASGTPHEDIPLILKQGFMEPEGAADVWMEMGEALEQWLRWCLERGFLTYGIITELYWRYLLPDPTYQQHLKRRYHGILADDVDEYPAVASRLFEFFLDQQIPIALTYNPDGGVRVGLGADPVALNLADRCLQVETLPIPPSLGSQWGSMLVGYLQEPMLLPPLPDSIQAILTTSRAELLRQTADVIINAVQTQQVLPQDIAVITPGMDAITRYTLREILTNRGISLFLLNDQSPLISAPLVRALLTLLALVYPGLGRLLNREAVAEMLVLLSQVPRQMLDGEGSVSVLPAKIDPVRAGLLMDHCFVPDPDQPHLLPVTAFPRWDRLGHQATQAYEDILQWLEAQKQQQQQRLIPSPVVLLDRAIQQFLYGGSHLPYNQLAILRELIETAQHYWDVDTRLHQHARAATSPSASVGQFIQLLQDGTITADPYPVRSPIARQSVTLATIYQYRSNRQSHRWQFWLDAGSPFWLTGGSGLFGSSLFLREWSGRPWSAADTLAADQRRLERQVLDLLGRATEKVFLCYSELATNGQEQTGVLLPLVNAAVPVAIEKGGRVEG